MKLKILKLTDKVYDQYKRFVKGNQDITKEMAEKKITRDVMVATEVPVRSDYEKQIGNRAWRYGNLLIITRRDKVVHIWNNKGVNAIAEWEVDETKRNELSKKLGIID
jgi:phosphopentomutase